MDQRVKESSLDPVTLEVVRAALAGKTRLSSGCGATSPRQFSAVLQLLLKPPPSQTATANMDRFSSVSKNALRRRAVNRDL